MFEKEYYISNIIAKSLRGELNHQEQGILNAWLNNNATNRAMFNSLSSEQEFLDEITVFRSANKASIWTKTQEKISQHAILSQQPRKKLFTFKKFHYLNIAAALFIIIGLVIFFKPAQEIKHVQEQKSVTNILPGKSTATLTLANGQKIILSDAINGKLVDNTGVSISKTPGGQLVYKLKDVRTNGIVSYNTLSTSRGEQYQVILPDGTKVWLNAASSLLYPETFAALKERKVKLVGEAYFEVAKNENQPFIVESEGQKVEVLGTHFNINSYVDEPAIKTTLLEGKVKINKSTFLMPNEQAIVTAGNIRVIPVMAEAFIDWKEGTFAFKSENLQSVMRKIARWYDVQVVYNLRDKETETYTGTISRSDHISKVLHVLGEIGGLNFKIEGKKIIVTN